MVSGPAPPPPPPPPANQQNKSLLRKSQRTSASATGTTNQSLSNQHPTAKENSGSKVRFSLCIPFILHYVIDVIK